jgi:aminotransferase class III
VAEALADLEDVIRYEGGHTIAAFILEPVVGTNGLLVPPDGYLQGVRAICDRHGILLVADEVMSGFGRTGRWFAVDHWGVVPDLITIAKGLTSAYVPLGAVGMGPAIARAFEERAFPSGLTYNSHPLACAAALAAIKVYEDEGLIENAARMGGFLSQHLAETERRHPSVGATRSIGLFGLVELVRSRTSYTPLAPFNGTSDESEFPSSCYRGRPGSDPGRLSPKNWTRLPALSSMIMFARVPARAGYGPNAMRTCLARSVATRPSKSSTIAPALTMPCTRMLFMTAGAAVRSGTDSSCLINSTIKPGPSSTTAALLSCLGVCSTTRRPSASAYQRALASRSATDNARKAPVARSIGGGSATARAGIAHDRHSTMQAVLMIAPQFRSPDKLVRDLSL